MNDLYIRFEEGTEEPLYIMRKLKELEFHYQSEFVAELNNDWQWCWDKGHILYSNKSLCRPLEPYEYVKYRLLGLLDG
jgi:hypothetical protein